MNNFIKKIVDYTLGLLLFWGLAIIIAFSIGYFFNIGASALMLVIGLAVGLLITHTITTYILNKIPRIAVILCVVVEWFAIYLYLKLYIDW